MNEDHISDAELAAFLSGEDDLSRELQALEQAAPSEKLDAAILARAAAMMARPPAANDAGPKLAPSPWRFGRRWRVPAGIAATLVVGWLAQQSLEQQSWEQHSWQRGGVIDGADRPQLPAAPAPASPVMAEPVTERVQAAPAPVAAAPLQGAKSPQRAPVMAAPAPVAEAASAADVEMPALPPPPPVPAAYPQISRRMAAPPPAAPASDLAQAKSAPREVTIAGRRSRTDVSTAPQARPAAAATPDPAAWLAAIEEMLSAGLRRDTLEEWDKFRAAYPDYPVPAATSDKIKALRD